MRKIAEIEYNEKTVNVFLWSNGDGYTVYCGKEFEFETEAEVITLCKEQGEIKKFTIYEPSLNGKSIADALNKHCNVAPDGPGLYY